MDRVEDVSDAWGPTPSNGWRGPGRLIMMLTTGASISRNSPSCCPRTVLDVGCGEGRVGRWLAARGHTVVGIDSSPTLTAAARESGGYEEIVCGDAACLPCSDNMFDLVVAYMSLHDMPDPEPVIGEIARVLRPGNPVAIATVHPLDRPDKDLDRYFETMRFHDAVTRDGLRMTFDGVERPLSDYTTALTRNSFVIDRLTEPRPSSEDCRADGSLIRAFERPYFLHIRCFQPR